MVQQHDKEPHPQGADTRTDGRIFFGSVYFLFHSDAAPNILQMLTAVSMVSHRGSHINVVRSGSPLTLARHGPHAIHGDAGAKGQLLCVRAAVSQRQYRDHFEKPKNRLQYLQGLTAQGPGLYPAGVENIPMERQHRSKDMITKTAVNHKNGLQRSFWHPRRDSNSLHSA